MQKQINFENDILWLLKQPVRIPCKFCNKNHLNYACDDQVKYLKKKIKKQKK